MYGRYNRTSTLSNFAWVKNILHRSLKSAIKKKGIENSRGHWAITSKLVKRHDSKRGRVKTIARGGRDLREAMIEIHNIRKL